MINNPKERQKQLKQLMSQLILAEEEGARIRAQESDPTIGTLQNGQGMLRID